MSTKTEVKNTELFALFLNKTKTGKKVLNGDGFIGFLNGNKKNPKEPDIRICKKDEDGKAVNEVCSLWSNISKAGKKYLAGKMSDGTRVIGFFTPAERMKKHNNKIPYINVYKSDEYKKEDNKPLEYSDDDLPF